MFALRKTCVRRMQGAGPHSAATHGDGRRGGESKASGAGKEWEIHVGPSFGADATIVSPTQTDCDAQGSVCTGNGRMLSQRVESTVPGPSG